MPSLTKCILTLHLDIFCYFTCHFKLVSKLASLLELGLIVTTFTDELKVEDFEEVFWLQIVSGVSLQGVFLGSHVENVPIN